ncbi:MAG: ribokinase [Armatimonadetes bacterium]|nr:ribokinase [Armatimonadota bacterium]
MPRIVVVGSANTDLIVKVPAIPAPGETVLGGDMARAPGGKGANQAVAAARLGAEVAFIGCLGTDDLGDAYLAHLEREGMDLRFLRRAEDRPSGVALIFVGPDGENAIAVAPGANAALTTADVDAAEDAFHGADTVLLQLEVPLAAVQRAAELGRRHGLRVILNPAPSPTTPLPEMLLSMTDVLTPNRHEAQALSGTAEAPASAAKRLRGAGVGAVVMTLGPEGAWLLSQEGERRVPGRRVPAVDATGAGDCFNGALAVALSEGRSLEEAVRWATVAASISVTRLGAQPSLPTRAEVEEAIQEGKTGISRNTAYNR